MVKKGEAFGAMIGQYPKQKRPEEPRSQVGKGLT
jgi:hypothetical protein